LNRIVGTFSTDARTPATVFATPASRTESPVPSCLLTSYKSRTLGEKSLRGAVSFALSGFDTHQSPPCPSVFGNAFQQWAMAVIGTDERCQNDERQAEKFH
jgi:hypothetical protein